MQYPFNFLALEVTRHGLRESCVVHIEEAVSPEVSSVDAWVEPRAGRMPQASDDWLTRMGYESAEIEPFHLGPTLAEHNDAVMKVMALHARERKRAKAEGRAEPPTPRLWFVCARHPRELLARWAMVSMEAKGWPRGFYESASPAGPRVVSLRELPCERSTLLLRLMGSGEVLRRAVEELKGLSEEAREVRIAAPILVQLRRDLPRMGVTVTWSSPEEYETMMSHEEAVRIWDEHVAANKAARQAAADLQQVLTEARRDLAEAERQKAEAERQAAEAERQAARSADAARGRFERRLGRPLTEGERATVGARLQALGGERLADVVVDLDAPALAAWLADPGAR